MPPGRPKNIESPDKLWEYFVAYQEETKAKPILVKDWVGKDGDEVNREKERPLTFEGFETWLFRNGILCDAADYFKNKDGRYTEFAPICRIIKAEIRRDQIEGGMAMIYNPSITQRLNGLVDKSAAEDKSELTIRVKYEQRSGHTPHGPASGAGTDTE